MESAHFAAWVRDYLDRIDLNQNQFSNEIGYHRSALSRHLKGRTISRPFLTAVVFGLEKLGAFEDPAEVIEVATLLGWKPEAVCAVIAKHLPGGEANNQGFFSWLRRWDRLKVQPNPEWERHPPHYVERTEKLKEIRELLTAKEWPWRQKRLVLWGMGGIGKTTLAQAIALNEEVQDHYYHGVLWAELGPNGDPYSWLKQWCCLLGQAVEDGDSVWVLHEKARKIMKTPGHRFLLIIDDVWRAQDVEPLLIDEPNVGVVLTMREKHPAQKLGWDDSFFLVDVMTKEEAEELVRRRLGARWQEEEAELCHEMIRLVGYLPLAVHLGAALVKERGWEWLLRPLRSRIHAVDSLAFSNPEGRQDSLGLTLDLSYENLSEPQRDLFERMGILSPGEIFVTWDIQMLTRDTVAFGSGTAKDIAIDRLLTELIEKGLVMDTSPMSGYRMHLLVGQYAAQKLGARKDAYQLWGQYFGEKTHVMVLAAGANEDICSGMPGGSHVAAAIFEEHWANFEWAWHRVQNLWRVLPSETRAITATEAYEWATSAGHRGCKCLWRRRDWAGVVRWAQEARRLHSEALWELFPILGRQEPDGEEEWGILLCWQIDGLLEQGKHVDAWPLIQELSHSDLQRRFAAWQVRSLVRETKGLIRAGEKENAHRRSHTIAYAMEKLNWIEDSVLHYHTMVEGYQVLGEYAAQWGDPLEAELRWWTACRTMTESRAWWNDRFGFDEWRLEQMVEQIVRLRAAHGNWERAARAGRLWVILRAWLCEKVGESLVDVGMWALQARQLETVAWAVEKLQAVQSDDRFEHPENGAKFALEKPSEINTDRHTVAQEFLRLAQDRCKTCSRHRELVERAWEALQTEEWPMPFEESLGPAYSPPRMWLDDFTFDTWLSNLVVAFTAPCGPYPQWAAERDTRAKGTDSEQTTWQ